MDLAIIKRDVSDNINLLHSLYGIEYKTTGYVKKSDELVLLDEILEGLSYLEKVIGLSNFPPIRKLIITMSKLYHGQYDITDKTIEISKFTVKDEVKKTLYHEYGHHMYYFLKIKPTYNAGLKVLLSDMNEMETLSGINYIGEVRKKEFEDKNGKTRSRATRYLNNYEKYLLEPTEVFARLVEGFCSGFLKLDIKDDWHFSESEMNVFNLYLNNLKEEMGCLI